MSATFTQEARNKSVTEYLGALVWDGTPRLDRWLVDCAGAEDSPWAEAALAEATDESIDLAATVPSA